MHTSREEKWMWLSNLKINCKYISDLFIKILFGRNCFWDYWIKSKCIKINGLILTYNIVKIMKQFIIVSLKKWTNVTILGRTIPIDDILEENMTLIGIVRSRHFVTFVHFLVLRKLNLHVKVLCIYSYISIIFSRYFKF